MPDRRGHLYAQDGADVPNNPLLNFGRFLAVIGWILIGLVAAFVWFCYWVNSDRLPRGFWDDPVVPLILGTPVFIGVVAAVIGHRVSWRFRQRRKRL